MIGIGRALVLLVVLLQAATAGAATARDLYNAAAARGQALRQAPRTGKSAPTLRQYRGAIAAFELVVRRFPKSGYADNSLWEGGQLALEAHERFGDDRERATATRLLTWLVQEYPTSRLAADARTALKQAAAPDAKSSPRNARKNTRPTEVKRGAPGTVADDEDEKRPAPPRPVSSAAAARVPAVSAAPPATITPTVLRDITRSIVGDTVRVSLQLDDEVVYRSERVETPARLVFDLSATRLGPAVGEGTITYSGDAVRHVRVGLHPNQVTRVVLDLEGVKSYSVFTLYSPFRIVVDCRRDGAAVPGTSAAAPGTSAAAPRPTSPSLPQTTVGEEPLNLPPAEELDPEPLEARAVSPGVFAPPTVSAPPAMTAPTRPPAVPSAYPVRRPPASTRPATAVPVPLRVTRSFGPSKRMPTWQPAVVEPARIVFPAASLERPGRAAAPERPILAPERPTTPAQRLTAPPERPIDSTDRTADTEKAAAADAPPAVPPTGFSLARQLGLGASRIVIDPGHGGHDPGAEGAGLFESTVVLDVALRLEKLLRAAGIDVVLTRRSDDYVPLDERTAIANRAQGDLFLSIHANASRKRSARGVETYFLNFATNPDAEAVAARENAETGRTMSNLTDIVKAIALNNKLDESKSLAAVVQRAMVEHLKAGNPAIKNHGVKQAPFVVLIGASMPSVLVEVSFITNREEGRLLKSGGYRQKIADALFEAVRNYQKSLKTVAALY